MGPRIRPIPSHETLWLSGTTILTITINTNLCLHSTVPIYNSQMSLLIGESRDNCIFGGKQRKRVEKLEKYSDTSMSFYQGHFVVLILPKNTFLFGGNPSPFFFIFFYFFRFFFLYMFFYVRLKFAFRELKTYLSNFPNNKDLPKYLNNLFFLIRS